MNLSDLSDLSYTKYIVMGTIALVILLVITLLGYFRGYHRLKENSGEVKHIRKPSTLAAVSVGFLVVLSSIVGLLIFLMIQADATKMDKDKVEKWMGADYAIADIQFTESTGSTQVADDDGIPTSKEMMTGVMDGQRISFYIHAGTDDVVHPMLVDKEIPRPYDKG